MAQANPLWGAPRIHGELLKLGLAISQASVSKYLVRRRMPPSQTWRTCLANHVGTLVSTNFFTVPTLLFKVVFVFVVMAHHRRRVVHVNVTETLTAQWTAQPLLEAFPWDTAPRYVLRDRDAVYGAVFSSQVRSLGIQEVKIAPRSPWQNPSVERFIGTLRRECLDPRGGAEPRPPTPRVARRSRVRPRGPDSPIPRQGRPGAQIGGASRPGPHRCDAHDRRPPSSVHPPGRIVSGRWRPQLC